jgi:N-acetylglutamate synthase-like GNAT family acetyltransferase
MSSGNLQKALIREARAGDAEAVKACVVAAFEHYIPRIGKPPAPMLLDFPAEIEARHVWLAESDGSVAGALVQYETEFGFYIDTVAVQPQLKGSGVGKALLQYAEQEAARRGYDSLYLVTNSKMVENQVLYPKIGYVEYDRQLQAGYQRVFYRKQLAAD